jgi:two-component system, cell cycle sensor histidine kinase and response regulator CckA
MGTDQSGSISVLLASKSFGTIKFIGRLLQGGAADGTGISGQSDAAAAAEELRQSQETLRNSEALYHSLVNHLPQHIFRKDLKGRFTFANDRFCALLGRSLSEIVGKTDRDFYPEASAERYRNDDSAIIKNGVTVERVEEHPGGSGRTLWVQVIKSPLYDSAGQIVGLQGIFWDITEKRDLEVQLRQAQKLDSIGRLASGVAHDFNNILTIIQAHAAMVVADDEASPAAVEAGRSISTATERAATLTRQLLAFGRSNNVKFRRIDLNRLIERSVGMLQRTLGENIIVEFIASSETLVVPADANMIEQVILNLALNSRDAMPAGGRFTIRTSHANGSCPELADESGNVATSMAMIEFSDTGLGIPPEHLPRICEPFFTTKDVGKGSGLGLATSYGIIKQHEGAMKITSTFQNGTSVRVWLPRVDAPAEVDREEPPISSAQVGNGTVLLVEDDNSIRELSFKYLVSVGYQVLSAGNGLEASRLWQEHKESIDVLVTDMVLPEGMTGSDLAGIFTAERPDLRVLFCTGYSSEMVENSIRFMYNSRCLQKPYSMKTLARSISELRGETPVMDGALAEV